MILTVCANPSVDCFWAIDSIQKGTTNRSRDESFFPGGKGIHTAFALNELGEEVETLAIWGGQTGVWLQQECRKRDIATLGPSIEEWNRLCITVQSDSNWDETELLGGGPSVGPKTAERFETSYTQSLGDKNIEAVLISGSAPAGFSDDLYARMVAEAKDHDIPAFVDASGSLLEEALEVQPHGIHINLKEGKELSKKDTPAKIAAWLANHCTLAAVTAGADGLYLAYKNELFHASYKLDESQITSTIGAGDCLLAGLCKAILKNEDPAYWAKFAAACGSANCIHPQLGMLKKADVERILNKVIINRSGYVTE
jgi:1-phosphofructokinase family hexose kinase